MLVVINNYVHDDDDEENVQTRLQCATSGAENGENPTKNGYLRPTPLSWMIPPRPKDKINLFFPSVYPNIHRICFCPAISDLTSIVNLGFYAAKSVKYTGFQFAR